MTPNDFYSMVTMLYYEDYKAKVQSQFLQTPTSSKIFDTDEGVRHAYEYLKENDLLVEKYLVLPKNKLVIITIERDW